MDNSLERLVSEVISRLAARLGADGSRGKLLVVLSGATARFSEAVNQVRTLVLDGYRVELVFSAAAEELYGIVFRRQLAGFPHVNTLTGSGWLSALGEAEALLIPLLSVNTLSKVSMLMADNTVTNLILHALFMGKTVLAAKNGADPDETARAALGLHRGSPALRKALLDRFHLLSTYGCVFTDVTKLRETLTALLAARQARAADGVQAVRVQNRSIETGRKVISAEDILRASRLGADLELSHSTLVTPLARELAWRHGVRLKTSE